MQDPVLSLLFDLIRRRSDLIADDLLRGVLVMELRPDGEVPAEAAETPEAYPLSW